MHIPRISPVEMVDKLRDLAQAEEYSEGKLTSRKLLPDPSSTNPPLLFPPSLLASSSDSTN